MLAAYRRHRKRCRRRRLGRSYRRCHCPIWVDGKLGAEEIRKSTGLRDWQKAQDLIRKWEVEGQRTEEPVTVERACEEFLRDAGVRGLREPTIYKYRLLLRQLKEFGQQNRLGFVNQFGLGVLRDFRASWLNRNVAARKKLEALRTFFRFCWESGWIPENPARKLKPPKTTAPPTMPFTREQFEQILTACDQFPGGRSAAGQVNAHRLRALVLLLRFSGLRIGDAVTLRRDRMVDGKLLLYTAKTGTPVYCPLPGFVVQALEMVQSTNQEYFFWTGSGSVKSCVRDWQRGLKRLFRRSGVPDGHAHRFRHTFAVELLLAGVPLERVAMLLGHQNSRVTEKHYAPWVRSRQEQLEADVKRVWSQFSDSLAATKGTRGVHGETHRVN